MHSDPRQEWRIADIERSLNGKADAHAVNSLRGDVDRLECALRESSTEIAGLRNEVSTIKNELLELVRIVETLATEPNP